jgi:hypothetical protein
MISSSLGREGIAGNPQGDVQGPGDPTAALLAHSYGLVAISARLGPEDLAGCDPDPIERGRFPPKRGRSRVAHRAALP